MKKISILSAILTAFILTISPARAGLYTDDLTKCVVEKTSEQDKINLIKWMFTAVTLHPAIASLASITEEQREKSNITIAKLFEKLLITSCITETREAVKYEGEKAIEAAFQVLGQVAARDLFAHPSVTAGMAQLEKHLDQKKFLKIYQTK